jgi:hypothetical protein
MSELVSYYLISGTDCRVMLTSQDIELSNVQLEPNYNIQYDVRSLSSTLLSVSAWVPLVCCALAQCQMSDG